MENNRTPELELHQPKGNSNTCSPRRRWRDHGILIANGLHRTRLAAPKLQRLDDDDDDVFSLTFWGRNYYFFLF